MSKARPTSTGAVRLEDDRQRRKRGLWWLWPLLGLLLLGLLLFLLLRGNDDDADRTAAEAKTEAATPTATPTQVPTDDEAAAGAGAAASSGAAAGAAGTLTAGGASLLPVADAGELTDSVGDPATGRNVTVQEIVPGQGFWVGSSASDRVYVELGGDVGQDEQPAGDVDLKVGDKVDLTGETRPAPEDPAKILNLDAKSAETVKSQGIFINADKVQPVS